MAATAAPQSAYFIDPGGEIVEVDSALAPSLSGQGGYSPASPKQIEEYQQEQKYGGAGQTVLAGLEGAGRGLSFGLLTPLERALGVPAEDIAGREKASPIASGIGTALGVAAPLVLSGGAAAPAEGIAAATRATAPSLIARAGQAVTKGVAGMLPEATGVAGKIAARAVAMGAGSAVEGAAYQLGQVVHEAALGDHDLTAQSVLAHVGLTAALAGGFGGILGAAEVALPTAIERAKEATAKVLNTAKGIAEKYYPAVAGSMTGLDSDTISEVMANRHEIFRDPKIRIKVAEDFGASLQQQYRSIEQALTGANRDIRPVESEAFSAGLDPQAARGEFERIHKLMDGVINQMREQPELYPGMYPKKLELIRDALARDWMHAEGNAAETNVPYGIFKTLNEAKQNLDPMSKFGRNIPPEHADGIAAIKALRADIKNSLQNEAVWGQAGVRQASFNEAQSEYFTALGQFRKDFMLKTVTKTGSLEFKVNPIKVNTYFNQMADTRGQMRSEVLDRYMDSSRKLVSEIENSYQNAPMGGYDKDALENLVNVTGTLTQQARRQAAVTQMVNQLDPRMSWGSMPVATAGKSGLGALFEIGGGALVGGPAGAALGAAHTFYNMVKDVPRAVGTLAALERAAQTISKQIDVAAGVLVRGSVKANYIARNEAAAGIAKSFGSSTEDSNARFQKRIGLLQKLQDPEQLHQTLVTQSDGLHEHAPQTAQAMQVTTARAVQFLLSKVPQTPQMGPLAPKWEHSQTDISRFSRYYEALENPTHILKQAAAGTLTPEAVEAVQAVTPQLMDKMRSAIVEKLSVNPKGVPYRNVLMLSMLMGHPMDGSTSPMAIQQNQAALAGPTAKGLNQPGPIKPTSKGASALTLSERSLTPMQQSGARK